MGVVEAVGDWLPWLPPPPEKLPVEGQAPSEGCEEVERAIAGAHNRPRGPALAPRQTSTSCTKN